MSTFEDALFEFLTSEDEFDDLINSRLYPTRRPEELNVGLPSVVYTLIDKPQDQTHDGPSGLKNPRYQFNIYAKSDEKAKEVAQALENVVQPLGPNETIGSNNTALVNASFVTDEQSGFNETSDEFTRIVDVKFWNEDVG